jgi:hypothetical protein
MKRSESLTVRTPNNRVERTWYDGGVFPVVIVPRAAHAER